MRDTEAKPSRHLPARLASEQKWAWTPDTIAEAFEAWFWRHHRAVTAWLLLLAAAALLTIAATGAAWIIRAL